MTINHKHYIEVMTIKKAKKRADIKLKKLQSLLVEIRVRYNLTLKYLDVFSLRARYTTTQLAS